MKRLRRLSLDWLNLKSSLTARCLGVVLCSAVLLLLTVLGISAAVDRQLNSSFPSLDTIIQYRDALEVDDVRQLSSPDLANCAIVVFDETGELLYASSVAASKDLTYDLVVDISDVDAIEVKDFAGMHDGTLQKYSYKTLVGQQRTLVCVLPAVNEAAFERLSSESARLWLLVVPAIALLSLGCGVLLTRIIRAGVRPLDVAISSYRIRGEISAEATRVPTELQPSLDGFVNLARQLDAARLEKQRLIADASHDLKTPLTVIRGYAQALDDGIVPPENQPAYIRAIATRSIMASDLMDALFSYAQMEHPEFVAHCSVEDMGALVRGIVDEKRLEVEQEGCEIECCIGSGQLAASVDSALIVRMLENLIGNACKHTAPGTHILLSCELEGAHVVLRVADDGCGIPHDLREHAFEPFVTNDKARSVGTGTGLGLAIARRCVESCGGTIRFEDVPRAPYHTEVVVSFPAGA